MIVMIEASTHTIANTWKNVRELEKGDEDERTYAAGMLDVLRDLGVTDPAAEPQEKPE